MHVGADTEITTAEYHTGGEPYRIVTSGVPTPEGETVLDRRAWSEQHLDDVRALLVNEPRGHADMYGCFVTPPDPDDGRDGRGAFGMVFFHKDGFSTACGHGTIAGATWAIESGRIDAVEPVTEVWIDVPSGRLHALADIDGGRVTGVRFENVPSYVTATDIAVDVDGVRYLVDVSYGGAFYASVDAAQLGISIAPEHLPTLIDVGRRIKWEIDAHPATHHPVDPRLGGCYGTIWYERLGDEGSTLHQRNVTIFADGEVDRSPCGSGTSARLAVLDHRGELARGHTLVHESVVGSQFRARVLGDGPTIASHPTVRTEVGGRAHRTGTNTVTYDPDDALGLGFQLR